MMDFIFNIMTVPETVQSREDKKLDRTNVMRGAGSSSRTKCFVRKLCPDFYSPQVIHILREWSPFSAKLI